MNPDFSSSKTVLVVDDEPQIRAIVKFILEKAGFQVIEAECGLKALDVVDRLGADPIDVVLTDVVMPRMNGVTFAGQFTERYPDTPVIFMSGFSNVEDSLLRALNVRWAFVPKPFAPEKLVDTVWSLLRAA